MEEIFEPNILTFCCNWCSYAAADLAGISRFQYPTNIRIVRVMCSGRVESVFILKAFREGLDGVLVTGCHIGDCHYIDGNRTAEERIGRMIKSLDKVGLEGRRVVTQAPEESLAQRHADDSAHGPEIEQFVWAKIFERRNDLADRHPFANQGADDGSDKRIEPPGVAPEP